jgi:hypothetical protein
MQNAMTRSFAAAVILLAAGVSSRAEEYQCDSDAGCSARINEDGELQEVTFRKGDLVSTEAGWDVSPDDGWVKVRTNNRGAGMAR